MPLIESCETNSMAEKLRDFHLHYHGALNSRYISLTSSMNTRKGSELKLLALEAVSAAARVQAQQTHLPRRRAHTCGLHHTPAPSWTQCADVTSFHRVPRTRAPLKLPNASSILCFVTRQAQKTRIACLWRRPLNVRGIYNSVSSQSFKYGTHIFISKLKKITPFCTLWMDF